ncbi:Checkpoint kinase 2 [Agyrium rufum]|nr:Checkpoint kinase 2 [Agyrium rufum]
MASIGASAEKCLDCFQEVQRLLAESEALEALEARSQVNGEFDRLQIWCGNLDVFGSGITSLDIRLRFSTVLHSGTIKILCSLQKTLEWMIDILGSASAASNILLHHENAREQECTESSDDDELQLILTRLLPATLRDLNKISFNVRSYLSGAVQPDASIALAKRDERSQLHDDKLSSIDSRKGGSLEEEMATIAELQGKDLEFKKAEPRKAEQLVENMDEKRARIVEKQLKNLKDWPEQFLWEAKLRDADYAWVEHLLPKFLNDAVSEKTIPQTVAGASPLLHRLVETVMLRRFKLRILYPRNNPGFEIDRCVWGLPLSPKLVPGQVEFVSKPGGNAPMLCPNPRDWMALVPYNLESYICTYENCEDRLQRYGDRESWLTHEQLAHHGEWLCPWHKTLHFEKKNELRGHLMFGHPNDITDAQVETVLEVSRSFTPDMREACPLCKINSQSFPDFHAHIADHLEEIALLSVYKYDTQGLILQPLKGNESTSAISAGNTIADPEKEASLTGWKESLDGLAAAPLLGGESSDLKLKHLSPGLDQKPRQELQDFGLAPGRSQSFSGSTSSPSFIFRIDEIEPKNAFGQVAMYRSQDWHPPKRRSALQTLSWGRHYRWKAGKATPIFENDPADRVYASASDQYSASTVFVNHLANHLVGVPYDARVRDVNGHWMPLGFGSRTHFSLPDRTRYTYSKVMLDGDKPRLSSAGEFAWLSLIFPQQYLPVKGKDTPNSETRNRGLIGDVATILALVALSARRDCVDDVLS